MGSSMKYTIYPVQIFNLIPISRVVLGNKNPCSSLISSAKYVIPQFSVRVYPLKKLNSSLMPCALINMSVYSLNTISLPQLAEITTVPPNHHINDIRVWILLVLGSIGLLIGSQLVENSGFFPIILKVN